MPQIPAFQQQQVLSVDRVPGIDSNPNAMGQADEAIARLGDISSDFAMSLLEKRQKAAAVDYAYSTHSQDQVDLEKYQQQLQLNMPKDYQGYTDSVNQWVQDRFEQNQKNAPSQLAKQMYQQQAHDFFSNTIVNASHTEFKQKAISYADNMNEDLERGSRLLQSTPRSDLAIDMLGDYQKRIKASTGTILDAESAHKMDEKAKNLMAKGVLDGLYAKALENPKQNKDFVQQAFDLLDGRVTADKNTGMSVERNPLVDGLLPHEKAMYQDKFARVREHGKDTNLSELYSRMRDDTFQALNGKQGDPTLWDDVHQAVQNDDIKPEEEIRLIDKRNAAYATGQLSSQYRITSPDKWDSIASGWQKKLDSVVADAALKNPALKAAQQPGFNAAERNGFMSQIVTPSGSAMMSPIGQQIMRERAEDPAAYVLKNIPGMANKSQMASGSDPSAAKSYITSQLAQQSALGIPNAYQRVTTKPEAAQIALNLQSANEQQAASQFNFLEQKYGPYFSRVFNEMVDDKKIDARYWVASFVQDPYSRQRILANVINGKDIDKAFHEKYEKEDVKSLTAAVKENSDPYISSIMQQSAGGGSAEKANGFNDVVLQEAKKLMITSASHMSPEDAAKKAMSVLTDNFGNVQAARSNVTFPRFINGQPVNHDLVQGFMESHLRPEAFDEMGVHLPGGVHLYDNLPADKQKQTFYENLKNNGHWITNASGDGMRLELQSPGSARRVVILGKDGQPLEYKYLDITQNADQRTLEQTGKGTLRKLWERITD